MTHTTLIRAATARTARPLALLALLLWAAVSAAQQAPASARRSQAVIDNAPAPVAMESVSMALGEIRMLPVKGKVRRIAVGNGAFVSATTVDSSLMLIGEQVGTTMLMAWTDRNLYTWQVRVVPSDFVATRRVVENILKGAGGVTVQEIDSKLVISGVAHRGIVENLATAVKDVPGVVLNVRTDEGSPLVRSVLFRLHFVEVNKALLEKLGVEWNKSAMGPAFAVQGAPITEGIYKPLPPAKEGDNLLDPEPPFVRRNNRASGIFFGIATSIASRLHLSGSDGDARILASPELTAKSGGKARLQVGGEIPIPMAGAFGTQTVEFKPYGIIFSIEPVIDGNDVITARLATELSQIDPAVSVAGIPGFITRSTSTEISVKPGEMIALSGLINSELSSAIEKIPGLGNVPILGRLFRSDEFRNRKTDLVVLLEPEIITAGDGMANRLRERGKDNVREFEEKAQVRPVDAPKPAPKDEPFRN